MIQKNSIILCVLASLLLYSVGVAETKNSPPSIMCIASLNNNTGDKQYNALAEGFADMLTATLSEQKNVKIVERQRLRDLLKEQKLSLLGLTDPATAVKVGKLLKADRIFVGGITKPKEKFIINVHAYEIDTARLVSSEQIQSKPAEIVTATYNLVNKLCKNLNLQLKPIDPNDIDKNPNASLHFMKGLGFFYAANYDRAIMQFMKTVDCDPLHTKARLWMAKAYMQTKEYAHAEIELKKIINDFPKCPEVSLAKSLLVQCKLHLKTNR